MGKGLTVTERYRKRYKTDPEFRLGELLRIYRRKRLYGRHGEYLRLALKKRTSGAKLAEWFGYTLSQLREHLERQFTRGMSWDRFAKGEIHIDHRLPLSSFDLTDPEQFRAAWSLPNLQPLWAEKNLQKSNRRELLL